jgi:hypothetical protein
MLAFFGFKSEGGAEEASMEDEVVLCVDWVFKS